MNRVNFLKLLCRSPHLHDKCRVLTNSIATSHVIHNKFPQSKTNVKQEYFDKNKKNYEDTFGNLESFDMKFQRIKDDPEDIIEYEREKAAQGKTMLQYIKEINSHLKNYDYESALKVLEVDMVNDKKKLCPYLYRVMINYNAKIGNLEEAYRLFINFKKRQGIVTGGMYTSMFNACANCKNSFLALKRAEDVEICMRKNKHHSINITNYNVMLKAYGRHGDINKCLNIIDEVLATRNKVKAYTYNFLLQSCISDKNSGLRHALVVWRKMIQSRVKPDGFCFQTMLMCVRECSLGDVTLVSEIIKDIQNESGEFFKRKVTVRTLADGQKIRKALKIPSTGGDLITPVEDKTSESVTKRDFIEVGNIETNPISQLAIEGEADTFGNMKIETETNCQLAEEDTLGNTKIETETNCQLAEEDTFGNMKIETETNRQLAEEDTFGNMKIENETNCQLAEEDTLGNLIENEGKDLELCSSEDTGVTTHSENLEVYDSTPVCTSQKNSDSLNLIAFKPTTGDVINFGVMTEPQHRFLLLGGVKGFLKTMREFGVKPDMKVFTLMLNVIPSSLQAEEELLSIIKAEGVELDTVFFNCLIKRRIYREEDSSVKVCSGKRVKLLGDNLGDNHQCFTFKRSDTLELMHSLNLKPDLITFGTLAIGCRTHELGMDLIRVLHNSGYRANVEILDTLLGKAIQANDMKYILFVTKTAKEDETELNAKFLARLSRFVGKTKARQNTEVEDIAEVDSSNLRETYQPRVS